MALWIKWSAQAHKDAIISSLSDKYRVVSMPFLYRDVRHALSVYDGALGAGIQR